MNVFKTKLNSFTNTKYLNTLVHISKLNFCKKKIILNHLDVRKSNKIAEDFEKLFDQSDYTDLAAAVQSELYHLELFKLLSNILFFIK